MHRDREGFEVIQDGQMVLPGKKHPSDVPPFEMGGGFAAGQRTVGGEAFQFQHVPVREELRIGAAVGIRGEGIVPDPFGEEEISQQVADPPCRVPKADFERPGTRPLI